MFQEQVETIQPVEKTSSASNKWIALIQQGVTGNFWLERTTCKLYSHGPQTSYAGF